MTASGKKGQRLSRKKCERNNNGANTRRFNCYSGSPEKQKSSAVFFCSRHEKGSHVFSRQRSSCLRSVDGFVSLSNRFLLFFHTSRLHKSCINKRVMGEITAFGSSLLSWTDSIRGVKLDCDAQQRFITAWLAIHLCICYKCETCILCANYMSVG